MLKTALIFCAMTVAAFALLCVFIYVRQDRLLFYQRPNAPELRDAWRSHRVEIASGEHVLEGWWATGGLPDSETVVLYFGGNAEDVLGMARTSQQLPCKRLLVVNYRGYGGTKGRPSQEALYADALAIYDYAIDAGQADPNAIVVMGRSLGSGVATMLAARRKVSAAILITPYDSMVAVASHHYSWLPVERLLKNPFPSADFAKQVRVPALFLIARNDTIIPPSHAHALAAAWAGEKIVHEFEGVGHNDIDFHPRYRATLDDFLTGIAKDSQPR